MDFDKLNRMFWKMIDDGDQIRLGMQKSISFDNAFVENNIPYGELGESNLYDLYFPQHYTRSPLPIIINIPGGGYTIGKKENNRLQSEFYAGLGYCVITMNYRRINEAKFPAPVYDLFSLFNHLEKKLDRNRYDFNNIFILGDSAGAHIGSLGCCILNSPKLQEEYGVKSDIKIKACAFCSSCFKIADIPLFGREYKKLIYGNNLAYDKKASPLDVMDAKFPPTIYVSPINDFIFLHSLLFKAKCKKLGIENRHLLILSGKHLGHTCNIKYAHLDYCQAINKKISDFFVEKMNEKQNLNTENQSAECC